MSGTDPSNLDLPPREHIARALLIIERTAGGGTPHRIAGPVADHLRAALAQLPPSPFAAAADRPGQPIPFSDPAAGFVPLADILPKK